MLVEVPPPPPLQPKLERVQIGAQLGWMFDASVDAPLGSVEVDQGLTYSLYADAVLRPGLLAEVSYTWLPTQLDFSDFEGGPERRLMGLDVHYFDAGIQGEFLVGQVRPFAELLLGATLFHPHSSLFGDEVRFNTIFGGGVKLFPVPNFGIRLQARLITSFTDVGSGIFCGVGTAGGACVAGTTGGGIVQAELSGGVFAAF
jgi:hypothetical protein